MKTRQRLALQAATVVALGGIALLRAKPASAMGDDWCSGAFQCVSECPADPCGACAPNPIFNCTDNVHDCPGQLKAYCAFET
jgi:hypothetical protein